MNETHEESVSMAVALNELLQAARRMAEGDFHRLVTVKAQGEVASSPTTSTTRFRICSRWTQRFAKASTGCPPWLPS